jgi:hypothetical protein
MHPLLEWLADDGVDDVGEVATAELRDLFARGECILHVNSVGSKLKDLLDCEALKLGHSDDFHIIALDDRLNTHRQVPQVPDGDCLVAWQVRPDFTTQESVDFCSKKRRKMRQD